MTAVFRAACVQMTSGRDLHSNIADAGALIAQAAGEGASFVATPENTTQIEPDKARVLAEARPEASHPAIPAFAEIAVKQGIWLLIGSLTVKLTDSLCANRSLLFAPSGEIAARYDKIHMFDVDIPDGQSYRESATFRPGAQAVLADLPWGKLGMTVCYDLRFARLYRGLAQAGAGVLTVPAAFTDFTGRAHWHVLLRARAIETGCFVIAPAQCGEHAGGRRTYGHSLIVAPWGEVLADGGDAPGVVTAEVDLAKVVEARGMVPSLDHDRDFALPDARLLRQAGE
ncbi:carbon-nitrogen hydrolase family protein [Algihabitans albus]|uniref:carbon-nitrogen hydrolase family protein n=1 Tax=Algihabitans albus TaxID=2164067 RepID=UPI000E5C7310|nr:carbon-nitrogen hydrolase family protein [Algihabitans albus]